MARSTAKAGEREGDSPIWRGKPSMGGCESTSGTERRARDSGAGPSWRVPAGSGTGTASSSSHLQGAAGGQ